jgi:hypothetical protein
MAKKTIDSVYALIVNHGSIPTTPRGIRRSFIRIGQPLTEDLFALGEADANGHAKRRRKKNSHRSKKAKPFWPPSKKAEPNSRRKR